ncbi:MAG: hypothetical protein QM809_11470 [Gordonia sp. (in: high G+C Gram-positive bacteria)]|uniref:hypothetical protein n=1 Tax=Gordonia sp. (in: high G+C Gram-positive bacteria) TaxID=84139 RepID=UPI0039E32BAB
MTAPLPLVTPADVCTMLTRPVPEETSAEYKQLAELCVQAAAEIRAKAPAVDARIAAGSLSVERVRGVAVDMVLAALETLELGFRSTGERHPEIETSQTSQSNRMLISMTPDQLKALMPPPVDVGGMYSVPYV